MNEIMIRRKIMERIQKRRMMRARIKFGLNTFFAALSLAAFVPVLRLISTAAEHSGFSAYLSLLTSDGLRVFGSGSSWFMSVVEAFPLLEITALSGLIFVLSYTLRYTISSWSYVSSHSQLTRLSVINTNNELN